MKPSCPAHPRLRLTLIGLLTACAALSACGGGDDDTAQTMAAPAATSAPPPAPEVAASEPVDAEAGEASEPDARIAAAASGQTPAAANTSSDYTIGVYYFPGWSSNLRGSAFTDPWAPIKAYPSRQPQLGWYRDSSNMTLRRQADMMRAGGIDFVTFDSYWDALGPFMDQALKAYMSVWKEGDPKVALMWSSHLPWQGGRANFEKMMDAWVANYLSKPNYLRINGQPVLYFFSVEEFENAALAMGITAAQLGAIVQQRAIAAGLPGVYMVGGTPGLAHWASVAVNAGFSALTAYNYHIGYSGDASTASAKPGNFAQLSANYQQNWQWIIKQSALPYITPVTSGWDKTPWLKVGETTYKAIATPAEFETHLRAAKTLMDSNPGKTNRTAVICCWNEFGEGSFIEPTLQKGTQVIDRVKTVFGSN